MEFKDKVNEIMNKKISRKKFLILVGTAIFAIPFLSKEVLAKIFFRKIDGTLLDLDQMAERAIVFPVSAEGDIITGTDVLGYEIIVPFKCEIKRAKAYATTAPTGADILFDINLNGSTIWSTQGDRLKITATNNAGSTSTFNTTALAEDDRLTVDVDQVGSTIAGANVVVELIVETR